MIRKLIDFVSIKLLGVVALLVLLLVAGLSYLYISIDLEVNDVTTELDNSQIGGSLNPLFFRPVLEPNSGLESLVDGSNSNRRVLVEDASDSLVGFTNTTNQALSYSREWYYLKDDQIYQLDGAPGEANCDLASTLALPQIRPSETIFSRINFKDWGLCSAGEEHSVDLPAGTYITAILLYPDNNGEEVEYYGYQYQLEDD